MKIHQASKLIKDLFEQSENKSKKKHFQKLLGVLTHLEGRDLTKEQLQSIEERIDELKLILHPQTKPKDLRRNGMEFMKFLRDHLSLISQGHYTALGVSFGPMLGTVIYSVSGHSISLGSGIGIGIAIGAAIGIFMDSEAERQNRVLVPRLKS